jgi:hypothetical protein
LLGPFSLEPYPQSLHGDGAQGVDSCRGAVGRNAEFLELAAVHFKKGGNYCEPWDTALGHRVICKQSIHEIMANLRPGIALVHLIFDSQNS